MSIHSYFVTSVSSMLKFETFLLLYFLFKMILAMNEPRCHYEIKNLWVIPFRNTCSQRFYKIGVLKNFTNMKTWCLEPQPAAVL